MIPHIPEKFSTRLIDRSPFVIMGNTMPPRDPDEDEEDEENEGTKTVPMNRRSYASRTKTRIACRWQSAYSISHELGCERHSGAGLIGLWLAPLSCCLFMAWLQDVDAQSKQSCCRPRSALSVTGATGIAVI